MGKVYIIKNVISGTYLRNSMGQIIFFISPASAWDYIETNLPANLWEVAKLRR